MHLPKRIFFTGVPGSRWSGIAQTIERLDGFNTSDRSSSRQYSHKNFSGHLGSYFGKGMELDPILDEVYIDNAWTDTKGCKIVKSHDWAYCLDDVRNKFPDDWIMLVYRPDMSSYAWWFEAGGFNIKYPNYSWYETPAKMLGEITKQNNSILEFAYKHKLKWSYFTEDFLLEHFEQTTEIGKEYKDILITILN